MKINASWYNSHNLLILFHEKLSSLRLINPTLRTDMEKLQYFVKWYDQEVESFGYKKTGKTVDLNLVAKYKEFLRKKNISQRSVNRRLAFIYKYFDFCVEQNIIDAQDLNQPEFSTQEKEISSHKLNQNILKEYKQHLNKSKLSSNTIKNYANDITDFINFTNSNK